MDANAAGLRRRSSRAAANVCYVRAAVEDLPPELTGIADRVTVILPWGSLLAAVARPVVPLLCGIRALCQPDATLTVVLGVDPVRDHAELERLELPALDSRHFLGALAEGYAAAGFRIGCVRAIAPAELARWPSTWARRLALGGARSAIQIEARLTRSDPGLSRWGSSFDG